VGIARGGNREADLFSQQERNRSRSRWLIVGFVLFFAWLGFGGDAVAFLSTRDAAPDAYHHRFPFLGLALAGIAAGIAWYSWRTGPEKVLWSTGAREIVAPATGAEQQLINVVEEMAIASGLPRPRVWIVPDDDPNAFATGHDERDAHVAVTEGLLRTLDRSELQAVVAHEMGHVRNLDVRLMTLLAALVGAVALIGDGVGRMIWRGGRVSSGRGSRGGKKGGGNGALVVILLALWLLSWILAPLITRLLAMSVSRSREFLADSMSAQFTRNPLALASALGKIESASSPTKSIRKGSAHLCIADPTGRASAVRPSRFAGILATHPPMSERMSRLEAMAYETESGDGSRETGVATA
jgi:heat shock protein HtpX